MLTTEGKTDIQLREDVEAALGDDVSLAPATVGVSVTDGVVTLSGQVRSAWQRFNAERDAERIDGVRGIVNEIAIHLETKASDTDIAAAAVEAIARNAQIPPGCVTVRVSNAWVTLKGELEHSYQRRAASRSIRDLRGVRGISNVITLRPVAHVDEIKERIERAFERQALIDAGTIQVSVQGHEVTLRGAVRSLAERREAERAAASCPGVSSVQDHLVVRR